MNRREIIAGSVASLGVAAVGREDAHASSAADKSTIADPKIAIQNIELSQINHNSPESHVYLAYRMSELGKQSDEPIVLSQDMFIIDGYLRYMNRYYCGGANTKWIKAIVLDRDYISYEHEGFIFGEDIKQKIEKGEENFWLTTSEGDTRAMIYTSTDDMKVMATTDEILWDGRGFYYDVSAHAFEDIMSSFVDLVNWNRYGHI